MKKVTIYITNYNYGHYLQEAVNSALNQTYKNIEILIFDDGSTDNSHQILQNLEQDERLHIIRNKNRGLNATIIEAFEKAAGDYVMRLDADDWLEETIIEQLVEEIEKSPNTALVFPDYYEVDETGRLLHQIKRHDFSKTVTLLDQPAHGACTLIRKSLYREVGGLSDAYSCQDGVDLWLALTHKYTVSNVNEPLFYYRKHQGSLSSNQLRILETRSRIYKEHAYKRAGQPKSALALIPIRAREINGQEFALQNIAGKTLVDWTIAKAERSEEIKEIVVLTESEKIIDYIHDNQENYHGPVKAHRRDPKTAVSGVDLAVSLNEYLNANPDLPYENIVVLTIETPFSRVNYIDTAIYAMYLYNTDSVDSVLNDNAIFYFHLGHGLKLWQDVKLRHERDNIYIRKGGITVIKKAALKDCQSLLTQRMGHIIIDKISAFEIESLEDIHIANIIGANLIGDENVG